MSFVPLVLLFLFASPSVLSVFVSNLDAICLKCLCHSSTGCNERYDCSAEGFCGPFFISKHYWEQAGSIALRPNVYSMDGGYEECVKDYQCASKVVASYMALKARDCNNDGVTDCDDYARIHFLGPSRCEESMDSYLFHKRYLTCRPPKTADDFSPLRRK